MRKLLLFHVFPLLTLVFPFLWVAVVGNREALKGESGLVELATVLFLLIAIGYSISGISIAGRLDIRGFLKAWLVLMILGSTYFALEELSYGQHIFGWEAGETFSELNDQQETNLHNIHAIFDQVPRAILTLGILVGGIIYPLYRRFRGIELQRSNRLYWQWPTLDCLTVGLLVILIRPVMSLFDTNILNIGETKESLFAMFIMLYCISIQWRLRELRDKVAPGAVAEGSGG
jgi:hypothetical protein